MEYKKIDFERRYSKIHRIIKKSYRVEQSNFELIKLSHKFLFQLKCSSFSTKISTLYFTEKFSNILSNKKEICKKYLIILFYENNMK